MKGLAPSENVETMVARISGGMDEPADLRYSGDMRCRCCSSSWIRIRSSTFIAGEKNQRQIIRNKQWLPWKKVMQQQQQTLYRFINKECGLREKYWPGI